jgi:alanine racemase
VGQLASTLPADIECRIYADTDDFLRRVSLAEFQHEVILLKGARKFGFERIARRLRKRSHSAVLRVDLGALDNNLRYFYGKISPGVGKIAVVKANAYGAGSLEICRFLSYQHVDMLAVALTDEGIELREAGINHPVMVLNPDPDGMELILDYHLEPEIYNLTILDKLLERCAYRQESARIHLKFDAGTNRLGFGPDDIDALVGRLAGQPGVRVATVFTHLSGSDEAKWDAFTHEQVGRFSAMYARLTDGLGYTPPRHVLSTSGILRFPEYQFEYVRLGIGLYGVGLSAHPELVPVHTLRARIIHIHPIKTGESVSYSRSFITDRPRMIATVNLGYADGLPRMAGDAGYSFRLHGRKAPITGRVCMDMTMIDVTDIPEAAIGDEVTVFGQEHPIDELAWICRTIPYEILTHLHPRIRKVYEHG